MKKNRQPYESARHSSNPIRSSASKAPETFTRIVKPSPPVQNMEQTELNARISEEIKAGRMKMVLSRHTSHRNRVCDVTLDGMVHRVMYNVLDCRVMMNLSKETQS